MWRWDRREGATVFAVAGCTLILPIPQNPGAGVFLNRGRLVFGATLVQHHRAFYSRKQPELRLIFYSSNGEEKPAAIETTGFFRGTPERLSPPGDKPRIRGAQQKNLPHGRFFVVRPSGFPLSGINLESAAHSKKTCLTAGFFVVRPSGFEPLAYRVGVCHSIQLSYGRIFSRSYYSKVRLKSKADFLFPFAAPDARCIQVQMRSPRRHKRPLAFDSKAAFSFRKCRDCNPGIYLIQS